jgi:phospholipid/cholesterol/gamma-HCH transport system substrate-binding protein
MLSRKWLETLVGLFVAAGIAALAVLAFKVSNIKSIDVAGSYRVELRFENIGGLKVKAPVTMSGVRIGRVAEIFFDKERYQAVAVLSIERQYDTLPVDTSASILTSGLLGEQYVALEAGGSDEYLKDGGQIKLTQSALVLEKLISQFLYNMAAKPEEKK